MPSAEITTPYLAVDVEVLYRNLAAMAERTRAGGLALRPHAKTHKCLEIGRLQLELGAVGLTVATVSEAEIFAAAGCTDLFIAYPIWAAGDRGRRLRALADNASLRVGLDSAESAGQLAAALSGAPAQVLVEVDSGHHRSGVAPADAGSLAAAAQESGLQVAGVFTFPGHSYGPGQPPTAAADEARALSEAAASLAAVGIEARVRSGGSTPTVAYTQAGAVTEVRPGIYPFNDAQQLELGTCGWSEVALTAVATVVSRRAGTIIVDAGSKVLGADRPPWVSGFGRLPDDPDAHVVALSEHHATASIADDAALPALGSLVRIAPNHVCSAVNLADDLVVTRGGEVVDRWRVAARGANT